VVMHRPLEGEGSALDVHSAWLRSVAAEKRAAVTGTDGALSPQSASSRARSRARSRGSRRSRPRLRRLRRLAVRLPAIENKIAVGFRGESNHDLVLNEPEVPGRAATPEPPERIG